LRGADFAAAVGFAVFATAAGFAGFGAATALGFAGFVEEADEEASAYARRLQGVRDDTSSWKSSGMNTQCDIVFSLMRHA
jgi:hypothetical protein